MLCVFCWLVCLFWVVSLVRLFWRASFFVFLGSVESQFSSAAAALCARMLNRSRAWSGTVPAAEAVARPFRTFSTALGLSRTMLTACWIDSGCSRTTSTTRTGSLLVFRSRLAARRHAWEHHSGGRPRPGLRTTTAPHRGHNTTPPPITSDGISRRDTLVHSRQLLIFTVFRRTLYPTRDTMALKTCSWVSLAS